MSELDPERFTLRQAAQARDDFAQVMDELNFVKWQLAALPTRWDQAFIQLRIILGSAVLSAALVIPLVGNVLAALPLTAGPRLRGCRAGRTVADAVRLLTHERAYQRRGNLDEHRLAQGRPNRNPEHEGKCSAPSQ